MKNIILIIVSLIFFIPKVFAITVSEAITQALENNTEFNAEKINISIANEDLKISKGEYLPTASITGSKSKEKTKELTNQGGGDAAITDVDPLTTSIKIEQTLLDFKRGAEYKKKKIGLDISDKKLIKKEQEIIYKSIEAYTGLILANEKKKLTREI